MTSFSHTIVKEEVGVRIDKVIATYLTDYSRQQIQIWIKDGEVSVNGHQIKANYKCKLGDEIVVNIVVVEQGAIGAEDIPLEIVYEDEYLLVVNKPKGMLVHPTPIIRTDTLANALLFHSSRLSNLSGEDRPGIVHRLDQDTSGLIVVAKDNETHQHLKEQFKAQTVKRIYEAIAVGVIDHNQGIIKAPIGRDPKARHKMAVVHDGKHAETHFEVLERFNDYTHVQCQLITGRTHQIRVHLKYIDHPIIGDRLYYKKKTPLTNSQALFAKRLGFVHPITNETMEFTIEQPEEFKQIIRYLKNKA